MDVVVQDDSSNHHPQHEQNSFLLLEPGYYLPEIVKLFISPWIYKTEKK